jgi:signal transduction histidine kinase
MIRSHYMRACALATPFIALAVGLVATAMLFMRTSGYEQEFERLKLEQRAHAHIAAIQGGLDDVMLELQVVNQAFDIFNPISRRQFEAFSRLMLERFPYLQAFSTESFEMDGSRPQYKAVSQSDGDVTPMWTVRPEQRMDHTGRHQTFSVTMPILRSGPASQPRAVIGYTWAIVDTNALVANTLRTASLIDTAEVEISVYAGISTSPSDLVYHQKSSAHDNAVESLLPSFLRRTPIVISRTLDAAGVRWHVVATTHSAPFSPEALGSRLTLLAGILFSLMIGYWMHLQVSHARRIQHLVDERTTELLSINERLVHDIAARQQAEEDLRHAQQVLTVAQKLGHLGSWELDAASGKLQCSDELFRICGLEPQSFAPTIDGLLDIVHPDDRDATKRVLMATCDEGKDFRIESRIMHPDGSIRYMISVGEATHDQHGQLSKVAGSMLDITEQKQTELALRRSQEELRQLAAYQERIREDERKQIAREVHDALGSLLTGIKAYLSVSIERSASADRPADRLLTEACDLVDIASETVRELITELRPSVLDQLGIWEALRWYAEQIEKRTQIMCECLIDDSTLAVVMDPERSVAIFRIVQEALTNVLRHAQAWWVTIRATRQGNTIVIEVEDNGKGSDAASLRKGDSWGIVGMHERARYFGGEFEIVGTPGKGTVATLRLPLDSLITE